MILGDPFREAEGPGAFAIVAPTFGDARDKCIESEESGLLMALGTSTAEVAAGHSARVAVWNRSMGELRLRDGTVVHIDGADDGAYRIQGYKLRGVWCDEVGLWKRWKTAWDESLVFALRKGQARRVATGTPKRDMAARTLVLRLLNDPKVISRQLRTRDNIMNLSEAFLDEVVGRYHGTELGRQELDGDLLEEAEGALWRLEWIEAARLVEPIAELRRTVIGLDPADGGEDGDTQGVCVAHADEHTAGQGQRRVRGHLRLRVGNAEIGVEAHHLAGRTHLGREQNVLAVEAVEREDRLLHRPILRPDFLGESKLLERLARHDLRGQFRQRLANRFAHERHRARRARVHF